MIYCARLIDSRKKFVLISGKTPGISTATVIHLGTSHTLHITKVTSLTSDMMLGASLGECSQTQREYGGKVDKTHQHLYRQNRQCTCEYM